MTNAEKYFIFCFTSISLNRNLLFLKKNTFFKMTNTIFEIDESFSWNTNHSTIPHNWELTARIKYLLSSYFLKIMLKRNVEIYSLRKVRRQYVCIRLLKKTVFAHEYSEMCDPASQVRKRRDVKFLWLLWFNLIKNCCILSLCFRGD